MKTRIQNFLNKHISENAKLIDVKKAEEALKLTRYGLKQYQLLDICYSEDDQTKQLNVIEKKYPELDMPMLISQDHNCREIQFFNSEYKKIFTRFFDIPILFGDQKYVYYRDFLEDKKRFGPPTLPSKEHVKNLITRTAIKDAKLKGQNWEHACQFQSVYDFFYRVLCDQLTEEETKQIKKEWSWFFPSLKKLQKHIGELRLAKIKTKYNPAKMNNYLKKIPFSLHHGDFSYINIGFNSEGKPLVINWEKLSYAPICYDFVLFISELPPLDFCDYYEEWYVEAYNNACDDPITYKHVSLIVERLKHFQFFVVKTLEMIYENKWKDEHGVHECEAKMRNYVEVLDSILKR
ncbi:MAG TPA: hypothetical protein PL063_02555 [Candidatus Cloacimonadota bacterium]|jgi:hypothetical protein|nr:hypothetical protein [Candidatus Cloacimonadales bacterium]HPY96076.1 hypothetical protein [Candidatus Cloacimonadota bacterium]HQB41690.1 hypothetical protein [Candidatus Cloacimonadota bacterium]